MFSYKMKAAILFVAALCVATTTSNTHAFTTTQPAFTRYTKLHSSDNKNVEDGKGVIATVKDKAVNVKDTVKDKAGDVKDYVKDKAGDVKDYVKDKAGTAKGKSPLYEYRHFTCSLVNTHRLLYHFLCKDKLVDAKDYVKDKAHDVKGKIFRGDQCQKSLLNSCDSQHAFGFPLLRCRRGR
jgi:Late embryogenesis abundant protein